MLLIFGQFWNQTRLSWDWQLIGGTPVDRSEADQFAYGFAQSYGVPTKVVTREGTTMYLPPVADEGQAQTWPLVGAAALIQTHPNRVQ